VQRALQKVHKEIVIFFYETFLLFYVVCTSWHATNTHISLSIVKRKEIRSCHVLYPDILLFLSMLTAVIILDILNALLLEIGYK
jgi:hypothetical protein